MIDAFIVCKRGVKDQVFIPKHFVGLVSDPEEHAYNLAKEAYYEDIPKDMVREPVMSGTMKAVFLE